MPSRSSLFHGTAALLLLAGAGGMVAAQTGKGGAKPRNEPSIDSATGSFEVGGVEVDVRGNSADAARQGGWRLAQRKGWEMLSRRMTGHTSSMSDSALDAMVTGIVVEQEQIGPTRYIARLGVLFDRGKAASILGVSGAVVRSPPMLLVPVQWSGGTAHVYERNTAWRDAWLRYRDGNSTIDYVKPRGNGSDALLLDGGQIGRRGRGWWRTILDQYGAADVLIAEVRLKQDYPGGPVTAIFAASHGPDKMLVTQFALKVSSADGLPAMLDQGIARIDRAYQDAMAGGRLKTDMMLAYRPPEAKTEEDAKDEDDSATPTPTPGPSDTASATFTVQIDTPSAGALTAGESAVRGVPGVRSANTTSLALGGISVMRVTYDGSISGLRSALEARGYQVQEGPGVLRIRKPGAGGDSN
ncbi:heavy-metal-associated domain-containing protein [Sphingomonas sp. LB-2]|uniref:heavy-metal-associated domain-containing protein n=1 Tax=Sphingomonas caeni TaxID=2984949 RepID=UPI00222F2AD7|nr:heavy-metal-associated domain-containing protein [Sphingomonas caeni]MCW3849182.1 heavy-metal-associated domain-containing protein [Sphingomonas caeni]